MRAYSSYSFPPNQDPTFFPARSFAVLMPVEDLETRSIALFWNICATSTNPQPFSWYFRRLETQVTPMSATPL